MNAARQTISRRAMSLTPRLGTSARFASTHAHPSMSKHDQGVMRSVFTAATVATASGVAYAVSILYLELEMLPIDLTASRKKS